MNKQKKPQKRGVARIPHPPQFTSTFIIHKKLRFQASASGSALPISVQAIGDLWCVATTATSAFQIADFIRIKKVEMWAPPTSSLAPVTVTIDWSGSNSAGLFGKSNRVSDTSMGSTEPAHILSRPPSGSQISQYLSAGTAATAFQLTFPSGTLIDFSYDLVARDNGQSIAVGGPVVGAFAGANFVRPLDSTLGTPVLIPVAYASV